MNAEAAASALLQLSGISNESPCIESHSDVATQTQPLSSRTVGTRTDLSIHTIGSLQEEFQKLQNEKLQLERAVCMKKLIEETFKCDDDQTNNLVKFYIGLPSYTVMMTVFNHISAHVKKHFRSIPLFEQ